MDSLMHAVGKVFKANEFNDDDIIDRLNHHFTVLFLVIAMVVVTTTQYVGSPINCWCPAYFTDSHIDFTNKVASHTEIKQTFIRPHRMQNMRMFCRVFISSLTCLRCWLGSRVVSVLASGAEGPGFKSQSRRCLRQTVHTHRASVHQAAKLVAALLRVAGVTAGLVESNGSLPPGQGRSQGGSWGSWDPQSNPTKINKDKTCTH